MNRNPSAYGLMQFFSFEHLPLGKLRDTSERCFKLANEIFNDDKLHGPELAIGLRKLLEAKDCFVRSAIDNQYDS